MVELLFVLCAFAVWYFCVIYKYKQSSYYKITKQPYLKMRSDLGLYGEYLTYKSLRSFEKNGAKILFNCYIPKKEGETTEVDLLLIDNSGIYVFESKNYSGWIFGKDNSRMWTQTLPQGRGRKAHKEQFLNPIFQNKLHIQCLADVLDEEYPMHSVVVFSDRCEFKDLNISNALVEVIHRSKTEHTVNKIKDHYGQAVTSENVDIIYEKLYKYTQVSEQVKQEHIDTIQRQRPVNKNNNTRNTETSSEVYGGSLNGQAGSLVDLSNNDDKEGTVVQGESEMICPKCGAILVLRMAKKGANQGKEFYGCSNYPKCKYIMNIKEDKK